MNEIPKYKKKKKKQVKKSNHKHQYKQCLVYDKKMNTLYLGDYCIICDKINNLVKPHILEQGWSRNLSKAEILLKYKYLEIKEVESIFKLK